MSENSILIAVFLFVVFVISILALAKNKNLKQNLKIPGASWNLETSGDTSKKDEVGEADPENKNSIDFGKENFFAGEMGDVAGESIDKTSSQTSEDDHQPKNSTISFGEKNIFTGKIGDIAAKNIKKDGK